MTKPEEKTYNIQKILSIFGSTISRQTIISAENKGTIPNAKRKKSGSVRVRQWPIDDLPQLGQHYGFLSSLKNHTVISIFTTKGGVLKTTLAFNIARMAALHNVSTCVIGLDLQGDITHALGLEPDVEDTDDLESAIEGLNSFRGLADIFNQECIIEDLLIKTDIPTLSVIPETPELALLEQNISRGLRREYWLKENITDPLKEKFNLIILDCGPNWNFLVTNALVACDILICPLECKINNFRNFNVFKTFTSSFKHTLRLNFNQLFVPTRLNSTRKLSSSIRAWYMANVPGCTTIGIRESSKGEEAMAARVSLPEYEPRSIVADEMRELIAEIWSKISTKS